MIRNDSGDIHDSLLNTNSSVTEQILTSSWQTSSLNAEAQERVEKAYRDETGWAMNGNDEHRMQRQSPQHQTVPSSSM